MDALCYGETRFTCERPIVDKQNTEDISQTIHLPNINDLKKRGISLPILLKAAFAIFCARQTGEREALFEE